MDNRYSGIRKKVMERRTRELAWPSRAESTEYETQYSLHRPEQNQFPTGIEFMNKKRGSQKRNPKAGEHGKGTRFHRVFLGVAASTRKKDTGETHTDEQGEI